jgi:hypothetical protein
MLWSNLNPKYHDHDQGVYMEKTFHTPRIPYQTPNLEQHPAWTHSTGVSLPIGTGISNPFDVNFEITELK